MAYTVASHWVAYGSSPEADIQCTLLSDFLQDVSDHPQDFEPTSLIDKPSGNVTSNWTKYQYKGLRISAIANQHIHLNRRSINCVDGHWRCLDFMEQHATDPVYNSKLFRWTKLRDEELFQHYHLDALSDLVRCYFRYYVVDNFSLENSLLECGFRENVREFRKLYRTIEENLRPKKMLPRWVDTMDKLALMCFDDPTVIAQDITLFKSDAGGYEKETDRLASRETYFCAKYLNSPDEVHSFLVDLDKTIVGAEETGLLGAANHLHRLRRAINRSQPFMS